MSKSLPQKTKIALTLNSVIFAAGLICVFFTFTGVKLTGADGTSSGADSLKFYTVLSNIAATVLSGVAAAYEYLSIKGKIKSLPKTLFILKLSGTVCVALTFVIVMIYLAPFAPDGFFSMFYNSNLFFHFLIPVLSVIVFVFFEGRNDIKFYGVFIGVAPTVAYGTVYAINAAFHTVNGEVIPEYDWYRFFYGGFLSAAAIFAVILCLSFFISFLLWKYNRKLSAEKKRVKTD